MWSYLVSWYLYVETRFYETKFKLKSYVTDTESVKYWDKKTDIIHNIKYYYYFLYLYNSLSSFSMYLHNRKNNILSKLNLTNGPVQITKNYKNGTQTIIANNNMFNIINDVNSYKGRHIINSNTIITKFQLLNNEDDDVNDECIRFLLLTHNTSCGDPQNIIDVFRFNGIIYENKILEIHRRRNRRKERYTLKFDEYKNLTIHDIYNSDISH